MLCPVDVDWNFKAEGMGLLNFKNYFRKLQPVVSGSSGTSLPVSRLVSRPAGDCPGLGRLCRRPQRFLDVPTTRISSQSGGCLGLANSSHPSPNSSQRLASSSSSSSHHRQSSSCQAGNRSLHPKQRSRLRSSRSKADAS